MNVLDVELPDIGKLPGPGWIWMRIAPGQTLDNLSRDLWPGETVLLRTERAAQLQAAGVVIPCPIFCGYLLPQIEGPA